MSTLKEDVKDVAIGVGYDLMIVAFIFCWIIAVVIALLEVSLWIVFGFFLLGCGFFFAVIVISRKHEEKEKLKEASESTLELIDIEEEKNN